MGLEQTAVVRTSWQRACWLAALAAGLAGCARPAPPASPPAPAAPPAAAPEGRLAALHGTWVLDTQAASARDLPGAERRQLKGARLTLNPDGSLTRALAGVQQAGTWSVRGDQLVMRSPPRVNEPGAAGSEDVVRYAVEVGGRALRLREESQEFVWRRP